MGLLFNTPGTEQIVKKLNQRYDDKPPGLPANRGDAAVYTNLAGYPTLWDVATQLQLYPGANPASGVARRWKCFLDFVDPLPDPNLGSTIGAILRNTIATACGDLNCESIEFFAVPDTVVHLSLSNLGSGGGKYSRIITLFTITADQMGCPQHP